MPTLGVGELSIILVIVVVLFGASRLPQLGEGMGKAIRSLKRGLRDADADLDAPALPDGQQDGGRSFQSSSSSEASR
jgi:sec-independent protein translocase protein TatA